MPTLSLSALKTGITRLRTKGGASPDTCYDLVNAYVTAARTISPRGGSEEMAELPEGTIGLTEFDDQLYVYASHDVGALPAGYQLVILLHPESNGLTLKRIWKAQPFMRQLFIVAEWSDGSIWPYWIETGNQWTPNTVYMLDGVVYPSDANGMRYRATRRYPADDAWAANIAVALGDVFEPTAPNGYKYTVIDTAGDNPRTGPTEPSWPASSGALVYEDADGSQSTTDQTGGSNGGRYDNPGGNMPSGG